MRPRQVGRQQEHAAKIFRDAGTRFVEKSLARLLDFGAWNRFGLKIKPWHGNSIAYVPTGGERHGKSTPMKSPAAAEAPFKDVTVAAYYYPCLHPHPRWDKAKYPGFTEWDLIKKAKPRFPGHRQPNVPVWGYEDDSDPKVMAKKIDAATDHGVGVFLFDWYYYNDGPYLERALDEGYLHAPNNHRTKFALMFANHDWFDIQDYDPREEVKLLYPGEITTETWEKITDIVIERYFKHPSYWRIDGRPYFSIYEMGKFLQSFGSVENARVALDNFRAKAVKAWPAGTAPQRDSLGRAESSRRHDSRRLGQALRRSRARQPDRLHVGSSRCAGL